MGIVPVADEPVEIVSLRVVGRGLERSRSRGPGACAAAWGLARAVGPSRLLRPSGGLDQTTPILSRADLATPREGPAVIEEYDATCVVPPGARAQLDASGNIVMEV